MAEWFASGRIFDVILALVALEAITLWLLRRRTGRGPELRALVPNLLAGAALMLALRFALTGASWLWIALFMLCSLIAHALDIASRWRP